MEEYHYFVAHEFGKQEKDDLRQAIEKAFEGTGLRPYYADLEVRQTHILEKIKDRIFRTQFGIYDITNTNRPNVFIELGLAMTANRPFFIICKKGTGIPADLAGLDRVEYESYKELTELVRTKILKLVNQPKIEVASPKLTRVNYWDSEHIKQWLKHPVGRGEGRDDFLYEIHGRVHNAPRNSEVRIWVLTNIKWPQSGSPVSETDGSWHGKIFLHIEDVKEFTKKERTDIGVDLFQLKSDLPTCNEIFTIQ